MRIKTMVLLLLFLLLFLFVLEIALRGYYGQRIQYDLDEDLYWKLKPNQTGFITLDIPPVSINSDGFRGGEFKETNCTVMLLGDSIVFGWGVADNETFAHYLEKYFNATIVNTAVPGYGLFQMQAAFNKTYLEYNPDKVFLFFSSFNLYRVPYETEKQKKAFFRRTTVLQQFGKFHVFTIFYLKTFYKWKLDIFETRTATPQKQLIEDLWEEQIEYIQEISEQLHEDDKQMIVILNKEEDEMFTERVKSDLNKLSVKTIDLAPFIEGVPRSKRVVSEFDPHPSPLIHLLVYESLLNKTAGSICS